MNEMYGSTLKNNSELSKESGDSDDSESQSNELAQVSQSLAKSPSGKIMSTSGLVVAVLLSLLIGLAFVVRSLKNVKLGLGLKLKRNERMEEK